jgi:predicted membrane chloride channel (bestrophin family)
MACKGRIFDVATVAVTTLPKERATRLVRYMNAAHAAGYVGLSDTYEYHSFFKQINESLKLLTDNELARMHAIDLDAGGSCHRELIVWCMNEIRSAQEAGELKDSELINTLRHEVMKLRAAMGKLFDAKDLPIPFFYVHFICFLTAMYMPLFALTAAMKAGTGKEVHMMADVIIGLVVFLQAVFVNGLRILGQKMSDPYGDDLEDLSVIFFVDFTWTHSNRILSSNFPGPISADEENELLKNRKFLGPAWSPEITPVS